MMQMSDVQIVSYEERYAVDFRRLNYLWLEKFFVPETEDHFILTHPESAIIEKGGFIFFAIKEDNVVGTAALIKSGTDVFELGKMAVLEAFQGKSIGGQLLAYCIDYARKQGARKLVLYSNTKLKPAIHLYEKFGFKEVAMDESVFDRADIRMELTL